MVKKTRSPSIAPLYQKTKRDLMQCNAQFLVTITGTDDTFSQTIHTQKLYPIDDLVWELQFADILSNRPDNLLQIDYSKFHELISSKAAQ